MNTWSKKKNKTTGFEWAEQYSQKTNCKKRAVGASVEFFINGKLKSISFGYNYHADGICKCVKGVQDSTVDHAESMAMVALDDRPLRIRRLIGHRLVLRATYQPCLKCAELIVKKGIEVVYFRDSKPEDQTAINYLNTHGVKVKQLWI